MKTLPLAKKAAVAESGTTIAGSATLAVLTRERPEVGVVVDWLTRNHHDVALQVQAALAKLVARGRHLPAEQRLDYSQKIVMGEFLVRWVKKNHRKSFRELQEEKHDEEVRPFTFALMCVANERAFAKVIPTLARKKVIAGYGGEIGDAYNFACFATNYAGVLGHRFLERFEPQRGGPAAAVAYLQTAAVSHYLYTGVLAVPDLEPLGRHLQNSTRMDTRTKLAAKLVYLPSLLTQRERRILHKRYGATGSLTKRRKVKDVAKLLGYPSAATLSRKLYRVKQWVGKPAKTPENEAKQ